MPQRIRVQNFTVSADGFATGAGQSLEQPFGHADPTELIAWGFATASWPGRTDGNGTRGLDDTTFHFLDATPSEAAKRACVAADGLDVRLSGGPTTIRSFLDADLVDEMHIVVAPLTLGAGVRLWDDPTELDDRFHHESVPSPSGVTHHLFWRRQ